MRSRIMYVEHKGGGITGPGRITRVTFSKSGSSVYVDGKRLQTLDGAGFKANYFEVETGEEYWVSGPKKDGRDRLYPGVVEVDEDVWEEYWVEIRRAPDRKHLTQFRSLPS
jgi:hypothetical protein